MFAIFNFVGSPALQVVRRSRWCDITGDATLQVVWRSRCNKNKNPHLNSTRREGSMRLVSVWKVSGLCLVSGRCLEGIRRVSGQCLEGV